MAFHMQEEIYDYISIQNSLRIICLIYPPTLWFLINICKNIIRAQLLKDLVIVAETNLDKLKFIQDLPEVIRFLNLIIDHKVLSMEDKIIISGYLHKHFLVCTSPSCHIILYFAENRIIHNHNIFIDFNNFRIYRKLIKENINRIYMHYRSM